MKMRHLSLVCLFVAGTTLFTPTFVQAKSILYKGFSVFGTCKYPDNFSHYDYVNPDAPQGGILHMGSPGTFDSLNPYIVLGTPPAGITMTHARLMDENHDQPGECYPYVAESMEMDENRRYVIFHLNPKAKFSDGKPITADDVIWSFEALKTKGFPMYRSYYKNITAVHKLSDHAVKFELDGMKNQELPLILGQLAILPRHFYENVPFDKPSLKIPPSSGPYSIEKMDAEHYVIYRKVKDWWGNSVPSQRGHYNFERIRYDFYLDSNTLFEAFKAGKVDVRLENTIKNWKTAYTFPAVTSGLIIREELKSDHNAHTYGFFFNTRRPIFQDVRVREALTLAFNFYWANKHLFYEGYKRNESYYPKSCFAATGLPDEEEKRLLEKYKDQLPSRVWTNEFKLPYTKTEREKREILSQAAQLFKEAGWHITNGRLINEKTKQPFEFEILISDSALEKICLLFAGDLKNLGIKVNIKSPDTTTFMHRMEHQNYDMLFRIIPQSDSLGNEQRDYFASSRADLPGSLNFSGIKNPAIDEIIEQLIQSKDYKTLCSRGRALDRIMLWNFYMIPAWHSDTDKVAYWDKFGRPKIAPKFNPVDFLTWWYDKEKADALEQKLKMTQTRSLWERLKEWVKGFL